MSKKYGNNLAWVFLEDGWETTRPLEVWHSLGNGEEEVMAHATDKYNAMQIVDALILSTNTKGSPDNQLTKKEIVFLQFVSGNCPEPWTTMADNAIMWNDREAYNTLKAKFSEIY
jgi:hypothetical protein